MQLVRHLVDMPFDELRNGSVVTIGSYDGLHLGHRHLLDRVLATAREKNVPAVVMSFEPTPKEFFQVSSPPARLMRFREKFDVLKDCGIDIFYCPRFSKSMRGISAADFVRRILIQSLNMSSLVVGDDFRFAHKREGGITQLRRTSELFNYSINQVPSVIVDGFRVSSTAIRQACEAGRMEQATALLGRPYRMSGKVVEGEKLGRSLGFPTANVDLRRRQCPVFGIFAVRVQGLPGGARDGVASVGSRPTFNGSKPLLEVFLFDFDDDIYGEYIHVDFIAFLRKQKKYDVVDDLVAQMHEDADNARSILTTHAA